MKALNSVFIGIAAGWMFLIGFYIANGTDMATLGPILLLAFGTTVPLYIANVSAHKKKSSTCTKKKSKKALENTL